MFFKIVEWDDYQGLVDVFGWASISVSSLDEPQFDVELAISQKLHHESGDWKEEDKSGDVAIWWMLSKQV